MSKIKCLSCGNEIDSDSNFCIHCGNKIIKSKGLLSKLIDRFILDKNPEETYDYFLKNKKDFLNFIDCFSQKDYIGDELKSQLQRDNEINYHVCKKIKDNLNDLKSDVDSDDLKLINLFITNYEHFDEKIKDLNKSIMDECYKEFKANKQNYINFIDKYKINISYDELISDDVKSDFKDEYQIIKTLINFENSENFDLGEDKKLIHEFFELYRHFSDVQDKINVEVNRRNCLINEYENIKPVILEFNKKYNIDSSHVYVKDYKSILDEYNSYYKICINLNKSLQSYHDDSLFEFLNIYANFKIVSHKLNIKFINKIYEDFLNVKDNVVKFIQNFKIRPSYDKIISLDIKEKFRKEADICMALKNYEESDNYNLKDNKRYIHEFVEIFFNFDKCVDKINMEVARRKNIVLKYEKDEKNILKFINTYKNNVPSNLYIKNSKLILDFYKTQYNKCLELSKLPSKYHKEEMSEFLDVYNNFGDISKNINENFISNNYKLYMENKSEILNQINQYNPITVEEYLNNKINFLEKFKKIADCFNNLLNLCPNLSEEDLFIFNNFLKLFDDFNGSYPKKIYKLFSSYIPHIKRFILKYNGSSECTAYIFDKQEILDEYIDSYKISHELNQLTQANELELNDEDEKLIENFTVMFDNFDEVIKKINICYIEKLNSNFLDKKESITKFITTFDKNNHLNDYIDIKRKSEIIKSNESNYNLCTEMNSIPEIKNNLIKEFIFKYDNLNDIIFILNKKYVTNLYEFNKDKISEYTNLINLSQDFYVSKSKLDDLCYHHNRYLGIVLNLLNYCSEEKYLNDLSLLTGFPQNSDELIHIVSDANESYINRELIENKELFDNVVRGKPLDENQRRAVVIDEDNTQIIAGAGCGKTLTLQAKAKYLIERKGINPDEILAISFSKLAQGDLERKMFEIGANIDVSTFHSLGLNTLRKNNIKSKVLEYGLKDAIKEYFLVKVINDVDKIQKIIEYFGYYMYEPLDKENIENIGEVYDYERGMDLETLYSKFEKLRDPTLKKTTLQGEKVKSLEERRIANFLFINGIKYTYEKEYEAKIDWKKTYEYLNNNLLKDMKIPKKIKQDLIYDIIDYLEIDEVLEWPRGGFVEKYHPDFYLDDYEIYYEHFGVNRECLAPWLPRKQSRAYKKEMRNKRFLHKRYGTKLIETYSYYQSENRLLDRLTEKLVDCGVKFKKMDYQQFMIDLLNDEEKINEYWDFIKLVETFISLFKGNGYEKDKFKEFRKENESLDESFLKEKHRLFLEIVEDIYDYYYEYLKKHGAIDFNDMINNATKMLKENEFYKNYKYIMVDEFQDTSHTRFNFLKTLKNKLNSKLIVVGDDWQSIYRFTGCDIDLFTNFESYFEDSKTEICYITNTYRNSQSLINVSGNFIMKNESQFSKQLNSKSKKQIDDTIKLYQYLNFLEQPYVFEVIINDIFNSANTNEVTILVLGRNRKDYKVLLNDELFKTSGSLNDKNLRIHYKKNPKINIKYMTVHGSKGLEEDNVVLINLENKKNGFPNKIEDDSVLSFVKNKNAESIQFSEERRLFYVALTRTKQRTYLLASKNKASEFVNEILSDIDIVDYDLDYDRDIIDDKIRVIASIDKQCPHCGTGKINLLYNPNTGIKFFKCSNWPKCDWYGGNFYENIEALNNPKYCPKCGGLLVKKDGFYGCMNYFPDKSCTYRVNINK